MPATVLPNSGINYDWDDGEGGIKVQLDENWATIDALMQVGVKSRATNAPPSSPANGDRYIIGSSPTGVWASNAGNIARYNDNTSLWEIFQPRVGWVAFIEDEDVLTVYKSTGWASGLSI